MKDNQLHDKKTILVIEDERPIRLAITEKLQMNNFNVVTCNNVEEALRLVATLPKLDLVWLDHYLMGKKTGLDFIVDIKNNIQKKDIPVFIVSVSVDPVTSFKYLQLGADSFYTKSDYGLQQIINDIIRHLNK